MNRPLYAFHQKGATCTLFVSGKKYTVRIAHGLGSYVVDVWVWKVNGCIGRGNPVAVWVNHQGPTGKRVVAAALFPGAKAKERKREN